MNDDDSPPPDDESPALEPGKGYTMPHPREAGPSTILLASAFAPIYTVTFCDGNKEYITRLYSEAVGRNMSTPDGGMRVSSGDTIGFVTKRSLTPQEVADRLGVVRPLGS